MRAKAFALFQLYCAWQRAKRVWLQLQSTTQSGDGRYAAMQAAWRRYSNFRAFAHEKPTPPKPSVNTVIDEIVSSELLHKVYWLFLEGATQLIETRKRVWYIAQSMQTAREVERTRSAVVSSTQLAYDLGFALGRMRDAEDIWSTISAHLATLRP